MLRASSLGLHLPPATIPSFLQCLRAPGVTIGRSSLISARRSSALHLPVHPRQISHDAQVDAESFRQDGTACPVVFSSSVEQQLWPVQRLETFVSGEPGQENASDSVEAGYIPESAIGIDLSIQSTMGSVTPQEAEVSAAVSLDHRVQEAPFLSGRPWSRQLPKPLRVNSRGGYGPQRRVVISFPGDEVENVEHIYQDMLRVLATTPSAKEGWKAYGVLSQLQQHFDVAENDKETTSIIPFAHLHRLVRVLARDLPKTRTRFLQLLSVLTTIRNYGGVIHLHEWNALIDHAGKGLRKTRPEDFNNSLSIYYDMVYDRPPGSQFSNAGFDEILNSHPENDPIGGYEPHTPATEPDIHTYTTLIDIAARTGSPPLLHRATMLLKHAKLPPNRITHLSLLKYFTTKKQLSGVRSTLVKMREQNLELGVDGLNACMWAYSHSKRVDTVMMIYRLLRHNVVPEDHNEYDNITYVQERLRIEEEIVISPEWRPNEVTFTLMIQTMAYHGNLLAALSVFLDMLSSPNIEQGAPLFLDENGDLQPTPYSPTIHVFRAILLGFSHHGVGPSTNAVRPNVNHDDLEWNLENLQNIFEKFLELPPDTKISESTIFWTLNSFSKTSNHDLETLRIVWQQLENRFGRFRGGPNHRLTKWRRKLFPETKKTEDSG